MVNVSEKNKDVCSGCGICESACPVHCIHMGSDSEGFLYPSVDESRCIKCGKCLRICPFEKTEDLRKPLKYKTAQSLLKAQIMNSSSGGIFGLLALKVISEGGVVFGARYNGAKVQHCKVETKEDINCILGSKYVQSDLGNSFAECLEELENGKKVLFSGTGCQVNALRHFLKEDYPNLLTVDIICHGVSSTLIFERYRAYVEKIRHKKIERINMRDKTTGWKSSRVHLYYTDGTDEHSSSLCALWPKLYQYNLTLRPSCFQCSFCQIKRCGDITLGDFWGFQAEKFPKIDLHLGVSEVLINTTKGNRWFNLISTSLKCEAITEEEAKERQPQLAHPSICPPKRTYFYKNLSRYPFYLIVAYYCGHGKLGKFISRIRRL